jgi:hypothetical protein
MTAAKRKALPSRLFGLPESRAYPMPDTAHAANAKARAGAALQAGRLSVRDFERIVRKADRIIRECRSSPSKNPGHPSRRCPVGTEIQSLLVPLAEGRAYARSWAQQHGLRADKIDAAGGDYCRLRQKAPGAFIPGSFRTINLHHGIRAVIGCPRRKKK